MQTFMDQKKRPWEVNLTWGLIEIVKSRHQINLMEIDENAMALLQEMTSDPSQLIRVAFTLVERQANERGIKFDEFAEAIMGDEILSVVTAITGEVGRFFPPARRMALASAVSINASAAGQITDGMATLMTAEMCQTIAATQSQKILDQLSTALKPFTSGLQGNSE